ncbi:LuxR C-terminal-related transcriptional regulator [Pseudoalteromonas xiamenensis]|uniref:LuxR C-terminal-related transcriptional regulator n=1 Tax=Pseudoalteromonas xiamenensis TaxID=882626 RepID=UPI0027E48F02|nr:LuxR C-terminal-related transcriptional regulator [Pseudoalteromonas xiamenensis]WMN61386.1 LuxR C-terminal-related transcriptional regulator [Pseudoalteromonas xiamenensis]
MDIKKFSSLAKRTTSISCFESIHLLCEEFAKLANMKQFIFTIVENNSLYSSKLRNFSNLSDEVKNDIKSSSEGESAFINCQLDNYTPQHWNATSSKGDSDVKMVATFFSKYGFSCGVNIPIKAKSGDLAFFNLVCETPLDANELDSILVFAHTFSSYLFASYVRIKEECGAVSKLSPRENDCLFWACEGKTAWEISKIIGLSQRTVTFHLMNIISKLQANNRQHAVALAIMKGIVKPTFRNVQV